MRKLLLLIVAAVVGVLAGCNGFGSSDANQVKDFANKFVQFVKSSNHDSIVAMYKGLEGLNVRFADLAGDVEVEEDSNSPGTFTVKIGNADLTVVRAQDGTMSITNSHGLLAFDPQKLDFARRTGQYKDGLGDVEQAQRMCDVGFEEYLINKINDNLMSGLQIVSRSGIDYIVGEGGMMEPSGYTVTVKNNSDYTIPGSCYKVVFRWIDMVEDDYYGYRDVNSSRTKNGVDLAPGQSETFSVHHIGYSPSASLSKHGLGEDALNNFNPTGTEFDDYLSTKSNDGKQADSGYDGTASDVPGNYVGEVGGSGCEMLINGSDGTYTMSYGGGTRTLKRQSPGVYKAYKQGQFIGTFRGKFTNGHYRGRFYNPRGNSSPFSLNLQSAL